MNLQVPIVIPSMSVETGRHELIQPRALYPKRGRRGCDKADSDRILYIYMSCGARHAAQASNVNVVANSACDVTVTVACAIRVSF